MEGPVIGIAILWKTFEMKIIWKETKNNSIDHWLNTSWFLFIVNHFIVHWKLYNILYVNTMVLCVMIHSTLWISWILNRIAHIVPFHFLFIHSHHCCFYSVYRCYFRSLSWFIISFISFILLLSSFVFNSSSLATVNIDFTLTKLFYLNICAHPTLYWRVYIEQKSKINDHTAVPLKFTNIFWLWRAFHIFRDCVRCTMNSVNPSSVFKLKFILRIEMFLTKQRTEHTNTEYTWAKWFQRIEK